MQIVIPGLYASPPQALSFAPSTHVRAFLLQRPQGNLLIYSAGTVADEARAIEGLGGISRHYLNHWHEAAFGGGDRVASTFGAPAVLASSDRASYIESLELIRELDFDVLVPWAATAGRPFHAVTDKGDTRRRIDAILDRVRGGDDH
jgi:hypothetical protein